jgi:hypothetical protein
MVARIGLPPPSGVASARAERPPRPGEWTCQIRLPLPPRLEVGSDRFSRGTLFPTELPWCRRPVRRLRG